MFEDFDEVEEYKLKAIYKENVYKSRIAFVNIFLKGLDECGFNLFWEVSSKPDREKINFFLKIVNFLSNEERFEDCAFIHKNLIRITTKKGIKLPTIETIS